MSLPTQPLQNASAIEGGYYPASIGQYFEGLKGDKLEIVRKLGYGPRSSTWLVKHVDKRYFAVKVFTIAASERARTVEAPIQEMANKVDTVRPVPRLHECFCVAGDAGSHTCFLLNPLSTSVRELQQEARNQRFPILTVQKIVSVVAEALEALHSVGIMHGAVRVDNIRFTPSSEYEYVNPFLNRECPSTGTDSKDGLAVTSQPLPHGCEWDEPRALVAGWPIRLDNLGHAQIFDPNWEDYENLPEDYYSCEEGNDYLFAPETLLKEATCSLETDIWMLGMTTFGLLTGRSPFDSKGKVWKRISTMRAFLNDKVPNEWLNDDEMEEYNPLSHRATTTLEENLVRELGKVDGRAAADFIKGCLRLGPWARLSASAVFQHDWLATANDEF